MTQQKLCNKVSEGTVSGIVKGTPNSHQTTMLLIKELGCFCYMCLNIIFNPSVDSHVYMFAQSENVIERNLELLEVDLLKRSVTTLPHTPSPKIFLG